MTGKTNVGGGGSTINGNDAVLRVTAPANSTVTISKGAISIADSGYGNISDPTLNNYYFVIHESQFDAINPWTVSAVNGTGYSSTTVIIDSADEYDVVLHPYLPIEYQMVEYIEKQSNSYIDTGLSLGSNDFQIDYKIRTESNVSGSTERPMVSIWTSSANYWSFFYSNSQTDWYLAQHTYISHGMTADSDYVYQIKRTGGTWTYAVTNVLGVTTSGTARTGYNPTANDTSLKIYARGDTQQKENGVGGRMYYANVLVAGNLERKLYPCYRKADSVSGMYDTVYGTFYPSAGSGTFLVGSDVI